MKSKSTGRNDKVTRYSSESGKPSGVSAYQIGDEYIIVYFHDYRYLYSYKSAGEDYVEQMKRLATSGKGLSTFISRNHPDYEWKEATYR